jgi:hypothetical protein
MRKSSGDFSLLLRILLLLLLLLLLLVEKTLRENFWGLEFFY